MKKQQASNNIEVKRINRNRVFRYVNAKGRASRPEIAEALGMSVPTVMQMVSELMERGLVREEGELKSTGGRKAKAIAPVWDSCYAIGVDITRNHIGLLATDLSGQILRHERLQQTFVNEDAYYEKVGEIFRQFVERAQVPKEKIKGVGISIPGEVDSVAGCVIRSHVLQVSHLSVDVFRRHIPYPCTMINDANAAGSMEGRGKDDGKHMVYLSLSNSVGGAILFKELSDDSGKSSVGNIYVGNHWRSGEFGHMVLHPEGQACYCGKKGCLDVYCSALRLARLAEDNRLETFFEKMEAGDAHLREVWEEYLDILAVAVENLHMAFDCDVVLGGYVGSFMEPYLEAFRRRIEKNNIFDDGGSYVKVCRYRVEASAFGAALYYIDQYVDAV